MWCLNWTDLESDGNKWLSLVNTVTNFRIPLNAGILLTVSFSRTILLHGVSYVSLGMTVVDNDVSCVGCLKWMKKKQVHKRPFCPSLNPTPSIVA